MRNVLRNESSDTLDKVKSAWWLLMAWWLCDSQGIRVVRGHIALVLLCWLLPRVPRLKWSHYNAFEIGYPTSFRGTRLPDKLRWFENKKEHQVKSPSNGLKVTYVLQSAAFKSVHLWNIHGGFVINRYSCMEHIWGSKQNGWYFDGIFKCLFSNR